MFKKLKKAAVLFALVGIAIIAISATTAVSQRIFTIGDSTVQDYNAGYAPRKGWGQVLQAFFSNTDVQVINKAVGGTSSRSFYNSFWSGVKKEMKSGDFVFIQFGINDRAADQARRAVGEDFKNFLRSYVKEARAMGVIPVLVSTVRRDAWANGLPYDSYHEHPQLVRDVAKELNVPLIDLDAKQKAGMIAVTSAYTGRYWSNTYVAGEYPNYPNGNTDQVHFQEMGAIQLAKYVIEEIQALGGNNELKKLIPFIKPQYPVTVTANHPEAGLITRTETYPSGLTIHLKALVNNGHKFINWKEANGTLATTKNIFQFTMGTSAKSYVAYFDDEISTKLDCNGTQNGSATLDNCGICTGGTTKKVACTSSVQAENACSVDGVLSEATNTGFLGAGYVNTDNAMGTKVVLSVNSAADQMIPVAIRYANGGTTNRNMTLKVNDGSVGEVVFPPTGSFATWETATLTLPLKVGNNVLELTSVTVDGGPNIDLLAFYNVGLTLGSCKVDCNGVLAGNAYLDGCTTCVGGNTNKEACTQDCNGDWGGIATTDNCGVCIGGNSSNLACTGSVEAEEACSLDGSVDNDNAGFSGLGFANTDNVLGASVSWKLNAIKNQTATISFRYANGGTTSRDGLLTINGITPNAVVLPPTGAWTTWEFTSINVDLNSGLNELILTSSTADGLANIDLVSFSEGVTDANCLVTGVDLFEYNDLNVYPNPTKNNVQWDTEQRWELYNVFGQELKNGRGKSIELANYPNGLYFVQLGDNHTHKIIKE